MARYEILKNDGILLNNNLFASSSGVTIDNGNIIINSDGSFSIGQNASPNNASSVIIGQNAGTTTGTIGGSFIAIGNNAGSGTLAINENALIIGIDAHGEGTGSISIGLRSDNNATNAISIGTDADVASNFAVAIGDTANTTSTADESVVIGRNASASGRYGVAIGTGSRINGWNYASGIGANAYGAALGAFMIGYRTSSNIQNTTENSVGFGWDEASPTVLFAKTVDSYINGSSGLGLGLNSGISAKLHVQGAGSTDVTNTLLIENSANADLFKIDDAGGFALGINSVIADIDSVIIGNQAGTADTIGTDLVAIGYGGGLSGKTFANNSISIGYQAIGEGESTVAIGLGAGNTTGTTAGSNNATMVGSRAGTGRTQSANIGLESTIIGYEAEGSGSRSVSIGTQSISNSAGSIAIGDTSEAKNTNNISIGQRAGATTGTVGDNAISIGPTSNQGTSDVGDDSIAIGLASESVGDFSIVIGTSSSSGETTNDIYGLSIGHNAYTNNDNTISIGRNSIASDFSGISMGYLSLNDSQRSIAIGESATTTNDWNISIGYRAGETTGTVNNRAISIGPDANQGTENIGVSSIALGDQTISSGARSVTIGDTSQTLASDSIAISTNALVTSDGANSISIGSNSSSANVDSVSLGIGAYTNAIEAIAIGETATSEAQRGVAIGALSSIASTGNQGVAIGYTASCQGVGALSINGTAIGQQSASFLGTSTGTRSISLGYLSTSVTDYSIAIGNEANASGGSEAISIGRDSDATAQRATAIGYLSQATASFAVAIGNGANVSTERGVAVRGTVSGARATAIGGATATNLRAIAIGETTVSSADEAVAIGYNCDSLVADGIAIGTTSLSTNGSISGNGSRTNTGGTAIGNNAQSNAGGFTIGQSAGSSTVANDVLGARSFGEFSNQNQFNSSGIIPGDFSTAIGRQTISGGGNAVAIGKGVATDADRAIMIGATGTPTSSNLGNYRMVNDQSDSIAFGFLNSNVATENLAPQFRFARTATSFISGSGAVVINNTLPTSLGTEPTETNSSVGLDLQSTTRVFKNNVVNETERDALTTAQGMQVLNTKEGEMNFYNESWKTQMSYEKNEITTTTNSTTELIGHSIDNNSIQPFDIEIYAVHDGGIAGTSGDALYAKYTGIIKNIAGTTSIVGSVSTNAIANDAGAGTWVISVTADDTTDELTVDVTGENNKSIRWVGNLTIKKEIF